MRHFPIHPKHVIALAVVAACCPVVGRAAELAEVWEGQPYRIQVQLAIDAPGDLAEQLAEQLPAYLKNRVHTSIGIVWRLKTEVATGSLRHQLLSGIDTFTFEDIADGEPDEDKRLLITIRATPWGYQLAAREFDYFVQRWGTTIHRSTRQLDALPELLFDLVRQAVAPVAQVRVDPSDPQLAVFHFRGSDLPPSGPDFAWAKLGDVFQPILRRTTRDGSLLPGGATVVPWTYLEIVDRPAEAPEAEQPKSTDPIDATHLVGRFRSATQRPLGARRGRVQEVAIGLPADPGNSTIRLQSRIDAKKPLIGYEVFAQNVDEKPLRPLGVSDAAGEVTITPGQSEVQMLYVKSGGVFLARVPIVPGTERLIVVPLPDDDVRLRVAARLAAFREDVIDLVARRNIFMARVRQEIEEKNFDRARTLLESLDELPGRTQFNLTLDREAQRFRTKDLQVQRRIDHLFSLTRTALDKFLDPQPISELYEELRQSQDHGKQADTDGDRKAS